jgi:hypothetical protein
MDTMTSRQKQPPAQSLCLLCKVLKGTTEKTEPTSITSSSWPVPPDLALHHNLDPQARGGLGLREQRLLSPELGTVPLHLLCSLLSRLFLSARPPAVLLALSSSRSRVAPTYYTAITLAEPSIPLPPGLYSDCAPVCLSLADSSYFKTHPKYQVLQEISAFPPGSDPSRSVSPRMLGVPEAGDQAPWVSTSPL